VKIRFFNEIDLFDKTCMILWYINQDFYSELLAFRV